MKTRFLILVGLAGVVVIAAGLLSFPIGRRAVPPNAEELLSAALEATPGPTAVSTSEVRFARVSRLNAPKDGPTVGADGRRVVKTSYADASAVTNLSEPASKAVQVLAQFAAAAGIRHFDPTVIAYRDQYNRQGVCSGTTLSTRTHSASVRGFVESMTSYFDAERPLDPEERTHGRDRWHECTGKWTEEEAVGETMAILERIGAGRTLEAVRNGSHSYEAKACMVKDPQGKPVKATPFVTVTLHDRNMRPVVQAQYRMSSNGPAGLTRWHHWPGSN